MLLLAEGENPASGKDIGQLVLRRHLDEPHLAILDDLGAKCFHMSMCLARSRLPMTLLPHSIHAVLSS